MPDAKLRFVEREDPERLPAERCRLEGHAWESVGVSSVSLCVVYGQGEEGGVRVKFVSLGDSGYPVTRWRLDRCVDCGKERRRYGPWWRKSPYTVSLEDLLGEERARELVEQFRSRG